SADYAEWRRDRHRVQPRRYSRRGVHRRLPRPAPANAGSKPGLPIADVRRIGNQAASERHAGAAGEPEEARRRYRSAQSRARRAGSTARHPPDDDLQDPQYVRRHTMDESQPFAVKKAFLYALIASVVLGALLGILTILSGRFGWLEVRVLLTTVTVAGASIC